MSGINSSTACDFTDLDFYHITAPQLDVDGKIKQRPVAPRR
ncbi:hypothetical protein [Acidocella sp. MX-AZ02]|nr:hypothetical protein [Acidocella sp. MX-AZ02]